MGAFFNKSTKGIWGHIWGGNETWSNLSFRVVEGGRHAWRTQLRSPIRNTIWNTWGNETPSSFVLVYTLSSTHNLRFDN
jgi:hypothetical protein